jgi:hypothetical protein
MGTSWQTQPLSLSADVYYINFANLIGSTTTGSEVLYFNQGGVIYKGIEAEGTAYVGMGFSVYANGSLNSAKDKGSDVQNPGLSINNAPKSTAALGIIYNRNGWYASLAQLYGGRGRTGVVAPGVDQAGVQQSVGQPQDHSARRLYGRSGHAAVLGAPRPQRIRDSVNAILMLRTRRRPRIAGRQFSLFTLVAGVFVDTLVWRSLVWCARSGYGCCG